MLLTHITFNWKFFGLQFTQSQSQLTLRYDQCLYLKTKTKFLHQNSNIRACTVILTREAQYNNLFWNSTVQRKDTFVCNYCHACKQLPKVIQITPDLLFPGNTRNYKTFVSLNLTAVEFDFKQQNAVQYGILLLRLF